MEAKAGWANRKPMKPSKQSGTIGESQMIKTNKQSWDAGGLLLHTVSQASVIIPAQVNTDMPATMLGISFLMSFEPHCYFICKVDTITIPILQMGKTGSERFSSSCKVTQLANAKIRI
jgi:hypothetical protein